MEAGADTESTKQHSAEPWHAEAPSDAASKRPHLHHLDGFRTFATLAILLHHRMHRDDLTLEKSQGPIRGFQDGAGLGVAYYNLLTGFVTAIACGEREMGSSTARAAFLVRRMGRVSFSYYVAFTIDWLLRLAFEGVEEAVADIEPRHSNTWMALLMLQGPLYGWFDPEGCKPRHGPLVPPSWTISVFLCYWLLYVYLLQP